LKLKSNIQLLNTTDELLNVCSGRKDILGVDIDIYDQRLHFDISFGDELVGLEAIVPVAREICDHITEVMVARNLERGERIPCCQGCSSCCNYLVTASSAEMFCLAEDIKNLDASLYEYFQRNSLLAARKILNKKPPENFDNIGLKRISNWYKSLNLSCPFLFEGGCSIYKFRPLSCREYFIKGSPRVCKGKRGAAEVLETPVSIANILSDLCAELEGEGDTSVIFALFQVWVNENSSRKMKQWPAEVMVQKFIELLERAVSQDRDLVESGF